MLNQLKRFALGSLLLLAAAYSSVGVAGDTLKRVVDFKVLNVGMTADQPPMNTVNRSGKSPRRRRHVQRLVLSAGSMLKPPLQGRLSFGGRFAEDEILHADVLV